MRYELFRTARDHGAAFLQLYLPCNSSKAMKRNQLRSGIAVVPAEALLRMAEMLEAPQPNRFSWEANSLTMQIGSDEGIDVNGGDGGTVDGGFRSSVAGGDSGIGMGIAGGGSSKGCVNAAETTCLQRDNPWPCHHDGSGEAGCMNPGPLLHPESQRTHYPGSSPLLPRQKQQPQLQCDEVSKDQETPGLQNVHPGVQVRAGDITALCTELWRYWGPPPPPPREDDQMRRREEGRAANAASLLHSLDLRSRRALGAAVVAAAPAERATVARSLNEQRRVLLQTAREVLQHLPLLNMAYESEGCGRGSADADDGVGGDGGGGRWEAQAEGHVRKRLQELEVEFMRAAGLEKDLLATVVSEEHSPGSASDASSEGEV
ncbi:hypothetical protein Vretimale_7783 [Volvox reticuliferus]|nr:hypothetical protein Vretifemale_5000 [Volvox reticuliferus]GIM03044.1 hypothetical protein Vretimale_7783 [Volvox reticuliferus]